MDLILNVNHSLKTKIFFKMQLFIWVNQLTEFLRSKVSGTVLPSLKANFVNKRDF